MFKLHKHKSGRGGESFDFKFSDIQAIQVPKGWDKLFVSLVSDETGKTIIKSGKTNVRNGICQWKETFHETVSIPQEKGEAKKLEDCLYKIVVAMGSSRASILGEVTINFTDYASSRTFVPLSLILGKCKYCTSLQLKIQCLTPNKRYRESQSRKTKNDVEYGDDETKINHDASDSAYSKSVPSMSDNHLKSHQHPKQDPSLSASDSQHSVDSIEASSENGTLSPQNDMFGPMTNPIFRQESVDSQNNRTSCDFHEIDDDNRSNQFSIRTRAVNQQEERNSTDFASPSHSNASSLINPLEATKVTIEDLRVEARMWQGNVQKPTFGCETIKKEMTEQSSSQDTLILQVNKCNSQKQEIEHLKSLLEESAKDYDDIVDLRLQIKDMDEIRKEMEDEIQFFKESNVKLTEQLQKTEESNIELLSILQELEAIIETQKSEIENLSSQKLKLQVSENPGLPVKTQLSSDHNVDDSDVVLPSQDADEQFPEGIHKIKLQLQQLQETQEELESAIQLLEKSVEEKDIEIEREQDLRTQSLLEYETKLMLQVAAKDEEILNLETKLSEVVKDQANIAKEINVLRRKVKDFEEDSDELAKENFELLSKLKEPKHSSLPLDNLVVSSYGSLDVNSPCICGAKVSLLRSQLNELQREIRRKESLVEDAETKILCSDLEYKCHELKIQLQNSIDNVVCVENELQKFRIQVEEVHGLQQQIKHYEAKETMTRGLQLLPDVNFAYSPNNLRKDEEIVVLGKKLKTLEEHVASVHDENILLQEHIQSLESEKSISTKYLEELKKEIVLLSITVESHISVSKVLERLSLELEKGKEDLEQHLSDIEKENMQLLKLISTLESQLRYVMDEKETCLLELQHSESQSMKLHNELRRLEIEMDKQKLDGIKNVEEMRNWWLKAQEECEDLKKVNQKLQSTAEILIEECNVLQNSNGELRRQNMELYTRCTVLEVRLRDYQGKFTECSKTIEALEAEFLVIVEEVSFKEKCLNSELEFLVIEDREHREKVMQENLSLNDMYLEKIVEVENLLREFAHLIEHISVADNEHNTLTSEAILEVYVLRADKAKLEATLQELRDQFSLSQSKLNNLESDTEAKVQQLTTALATLRKNQDILMTNHDKMLVSLESSKISEEKCKRDINRLEINLKRSEYEMLQQEQENSSLKEQLKKVTQIQAEVLDLKAALVEAKFEYKRVQASFDFLCTDHEQLKIEKDSLVLKISSMQKSVLELENCQRSKIALEDKILRLEGDLAAKEELRVEDAELKFELSKFKRATGELQLKIKHLEQDLEEYLNRVQVLQAQLQLNYQAMHNQMNSVGKHADLNDECIVVVSFTGKEKKQLEMTEAENIDYMSKIQSLEIELARALEANDMYKTEITRFMSQERNCSGSPKASGSGVNFNVKQKESNMSFLELELRDLQEKHFQMSLKYAEVEAQRSELVLKLKSTNNNRRSWFS